MTTRTDRIFQMLSMNESVVEAARDPSTPENTNNNEEVHKIHQKNEMLPSTSTSYVVEMDNFTKMRLRRVQKTSYENKENSTNSISDFSSGSSDNYEPPNVNESSSSSSSSPKSQREIRESVQNVDSERQVQADNENPVPKRGKKRLRHPEKWIKNKAKRLKNTGQSYKSRTGKTVEARKMGSPCTEKCILACSNKVPESSRSTLFKDYWELGSLQRQRDFLSSCIEQLQLKYRRISSAQPRKPNCSFHIFDNGFKIRVCKTFLISTLGISERTIRTVIQSKQGGTGIVAEDRRGRHNHHKKIDDEVVQSVRDHINSVPRIEAHYIRSDSSREFIDGGLTIAELHRAYKEERSTAGKPAATYDKYARIFNTEFNIGFFIPKKDQCDLCESYKNAVGDSKNEIENKYKTHLQEKTLSRLEKDQDKAKARRREIVVVVYDLQAVLPVPMGQTSAFFYKSRLNCYNLTVSEIENDHSVCFFWHEGLGHRGTNEIASCVLKYLEDLSKKRPGVDVVCYSDNCGGQQKNRFMMAAYLYAVERFQINSITHKYLIRGHTQNEGDAVHSIIEKAVKNAKKSGPIYVPDQYVHLMRNAKKKGNRLIVKETSFEDFVDVKALFDEMAPNFLKDVDGNEFKINDVKLLQFEKSSETIRFKISYEQSEWNCIPFKIEKRKRRVSNFKPITDIELKPAYKNKISIAENKKRDLKSLIDSNIIPAFYKPFYETLF